MAAVNTPPKKSSRTGKHSLLASTALVLSQLLVGLGAAQSASATIFTYDLLDGSDGALGSEEYGLRIDDLFSVSNNFTFSFEDASSDVDLIIDTTAATARITGVITGGEDLGAGRRFGGGTRLELDFLYNDGLTIIDTTTGFFEVAAGAMNFGTVTLLDALNVDPAVVPSGEASPGGVIQLADFNGGSVFTGEEVIIDLLTSDSVLAAIASPTPSVATAQGLRQFDFKVAGLPLNPPIVSTPEPSVLLLMGLGLLGLGVSRKLKG